LAGCPEPWTVWPAMPLQPGLDINYATVSNTTGLANHRLTLIGCRDVSRPIVPRLSTNNAPNRISLVTETSEFWKSSGTGDYGK